MRTILIHLNVEVPADDEREAFAIAQSVMDAYDVGSDHPSVARLRPVIALAEEV